MCLCLHVVIVDACVEKSPHFFKNRVPFCLAAVSFVVSCLKFEFWIVLVSRNRICAAIFFFVQNFFTERMMKHILLVISSLLLNLLVAVIGIE